MTGYIPVAEVRKNLHKIGETCRLTGTTPRSLRWYEKLGLLPSTKKTRGRIRLYSEQEINLIKEIKKLQQKDLSLNEIKEYFQKTKKIVLPVKTIKIFIDSAFSFFPEEIADKNIFEVIPMTINLGFYKYKDLTGFAPGLLSEVEKKKRKLATTAAPSTVEYCQIFEKALAEGYTQIISLHPDSRLSGSYEQAFLAAQRLSTLPIRVIDTKLFSLGFYFLYETLKSVKVITIGLLEKALKNMQNSVTEIVVINSLERLGLDKLPEFSKLILDCVPILQHTAVHGLQPVAREKDTRAAVKYIIDNLPKQVELVFGYAEKGLLNLVSSFRDKKNIKNIPYSAVIPANFGRSLWGLALKSC